MSLTKRIVGLVVLALIPALAVQGYNEYALRTARAEAVRNEAMRAARSVAADLGQFGRGARQVLGILAGLSEIRWASATDPRPYSFDFRIGEGAEARWISARGVGGEAGRVGEWVQAIFLDITDRKRAEEAEHLDLRRNDPLSAPKFRLIST